VGIRVSGVTRSGDISFGVFANSVIQPGTVVLLFAPFETLVDAKRADRDYALCIAHGLFALDPSAQARALRTEFMSQLRGACMEEQLRLPPANRHRFTIKPATLNCQFGFMVNHAPRSRANVTLAKLMPRSMHAPYALLVAKRIIRCHEELFWDYKNNASRGFGPYRPVMQTLKTYYRNCKRCGARISGSRAANFHNLNCARLASM
jgi:hypothetical protein